MLVIGPMQDDSVADERSDPIPWRVGTATCGAYVTTGHGRAGPEAGVREPSVAGVVPV